ncbi:outer membrane protein transport protein (OMPP1/FadL/TodX) [Ancylomarina subtilis]|uniref:Outer membrane protein transport protein (OMPP1/FadL/TodX) n=1 Tax=Ancylomarina subtilis TaxID=1639035 RepID=A0A4Q7V9Q7_9BACT|nr:outer membrane protein transport protein [Ancylomarina subtilis]RZT93501.1 outer membrane protein transport protein (OMPP1/FadL/TodX) [Ancylomarina subtilis]
MKRYITLLFLTVFSGILYAQTADDALRYSQQHYTGTARSTAMGGAFGALGGDFSSIGINPAGLAVYQSSEFTFSPTMEMRKSTSGNLNDDKFTFGISNIGYVATFKPRITSKDGWQNFNFGIGYNRINNFRKSSISQISASESSMLDVFEANADGLTENQLNSTERLAYETYLLNPQDENPLDYDLPIFPGEKMNQRKTIEERGHMGEFNIALGANYAHKLYLGATLGIQSINYKSTARFTESTLSSSASDLNDYYLEEYVKTTGVGANLKLGLIYKPNQNIRLGASLHTPTFFSMEDEFQNEIASHFKTEDLDGYSNYRDRTRLSSYTYKYRTPMKFTLSGAVVLSKKALISLDYEFIDYSNAKFSDGEDDFDFNGTTEFPEANDIIKSSYESVGNLRAGLEYRVSSAFSLRGGFANYGNPYKSSAVDESYNVYSAGFGIRQGNFFFDAAYSYSNKDEAYLYYSSQDLDGNLISSERVNLEDENHQVRLTFGFKF